MAITTGTIIPFGGASVPTGFLLCDGSTVSRTTYADLFSAIGTTYGPGDGLTTFNLPDLTNQLISPPSSAINYVIATDATGTGTVANVALSTNAGWFTVTGSPVTTSGTLTSNLTTGLAANRVLATPTGSTGAVGLRTLVGNDLPNPSSTQKGGVRSLASAASKWINAISTSGVPSATQPAFTDISGTLGTSQLPLNTKLSTVGTVVDGGGLVLTTGQKGYAYCPFSCTITAATLIADVVGSIVVDIWKSAYNSIPTVANSITASAPPTLTSAQTSQNTTLLGWTTTVAAGDVFGFNINSVSGVKRIALQLTVVRS